MRRNVYFIMCECGDLMKWNNDHLAQSGGVREERKGGGLRGVGRGLAYLWRDCVSVLFFSFIISKYHE